MDFMNPPNPSFPPIDPHLAFSHRPELWQQPHDPSLEEAMWRMTLRPPEMVEPSYPERPDEPDCSYYMRTGLCSFGANCKYNHPPDRRLAPSTSRIRGDYPQRIGQPECQYYLKTGVCKFGATCKYHHPPEKAGLTGPVQLNVLNLPLRPGEKDCAFYLRTGHCKYGATCKFNHPPPMQAMPGSLPGASGVPPAQPYLAGWPRARPSYLSPPRNFAPVLLPSPQGVVPVPSWSPYQQAPLPFQEGQQQASYMYGPALPEPVAMGMFPPFIPSSPSIRLPTPPSPSTSGPREAMYPERPGQPECQYYMKTGECRFGLQCKFHHPADRTISQHGSVLSPIGLPLRPGAPPCNFYSRFGYCRFGPTCKFDHSMPSAYSHVLPDISGAQYPLGVSGAPAHNVPTASPDIQGQSSTRGESGIINQQHGIDGSS